MKIRPLRDQVIVRLVEEEKSKEKKIHIPEMIKEAPVKGVVLAVGPGTTDKKGRLRRLDINAGETVYYKSGMGYMIIAGGESYVVLKEKDILLKEVGDGQER